MAKRALKTWSVSYGRIPASICQNPNRLVVSAEELRLRIPLLLSESGKTKPVKALKFQPWVESSKSYSSIICTIGVGVGEGVGLGVGVSVGVGVGLGVGVGVSVGVAVGVGEGVGDGEGDGEGVGLGVGVSVGVGVGLGVGVGVGMG
jgi:hypothetical protein